MKIGGVEVTKCEEVLVLYRPDGNHIPFKAIAVSIGDEFEEKVPKPTAPLIQKKGEKYPDLNDKEYQRQVKHRDDLRFAYLCLKSLEPSNIEWSEVDLNKPGTWLKWTDELQEAGLSEQELNRVVNTIMVANALDENKIEEARKSFLLGQGA